jgi:ADP-heptose:LPS heptosyltransferase
MVAPKNILLIRLKSIGDVILTLPAVHVVRENFPDARITFLTLKENVPFLQGFRDVDETIVIDRKILRGGNPLKVAPEIFRFLRRVRAGKFSLAVDFHGCGESAWLARFSGAAQRWGSVYKNSRRWFYTHGVTRNVQLHPADWNISLLQQCGLKTSQARNEFVLPETSLVAARQWFAENKLDANRPTLYLQPFTSLPEKNWPLENYLTLAEHWRARGFQIIFGGGPDDQPALESVRGLGHAISCGLPKLTDAALMNFSTLVIGGDTGFMHLAVALGKRVLMLVKLDDAGPPPFGHADWVIHPDEGPALSQLSFERVLAEANSALADEHCLK